MSTADKLNKLITTKAAIKQALIDKGLNPSDVFSTYADNIRSISSGGGGYEFDFTVLGYNLEECKDANDIANAAISLGDFTQSLITEAIAYGKELYDSNYSITDNNVDKNKLLFYPKLKLPYAYRYSKVLYIPNVEYSASGSYITNNAYLNYFLYKVGSINAEFTSSHYSLGFFNDCSSLREVGDINITGKVINYSEFFLKCYALSKIGNMNTTGSTSFQQMFYNCISLTTIPLLNTSSGTNFTRMFEGCSSITTIPQLDTSKGTTFSSMFSSCTSLTTIPLLDTSKGTNLSYMFYGCTSLTSIPQMDTSKGTNFLLMFSGCSSLTSISQLNTSKGTTFNLMFSYCSSLTTIPLLDTSKSTDFRSMFLNCSELKRIEGISLKSLNKTIDNYYLTGFDSMTTLRYALIKDIGTCTGMTSAKFTYWTVWGIDDETSPDARQSLIDTLITYSFDRATAGYSACTVELSTNTKALLTEDEIAQITIKGYTIA